MKWEGLARRDKTRQLLAEALHLAAPDVPHCNAGSRAVDVENAVFAQNGGINAKYKAKVRSLSFNLKDPKNPDLRRRVLAGSISGEQCGMHPCGEMLRDESHLLASGWQGACMQ